MTKLIDVMRQKHSGLGKRVTKKNLVVRGTDKYEECLKMLEDGYNQFTITKRLHMGRDVVRRIKEENGM